MKARSLPLRRTLLVSSSKPAVVAQAEDLTSLGKQIHFMSLNNGLTVLLFERDATPLFSVFTHVDIGSNRNVFGLGLAHMH